MKIKLNKFLNENKYEISIKEVYDSLILVEIICRFFYILEEKIEKDLSSEEIEKEISNSLDTAIEEIYKEEVDIELENIFNKIFNTQLSKIFLKGKIRTFLSELTTKEYADLFIENREDKYEYFEKIIKVEEIYSGKIEKNLTIPRKIRDYFEDNAFRKKDIKALKDLTVGDLIRALDNINKIEKILKELKEKKNISEDIEKQLEEIKISLELFWQLFLREVYPKKGEEIFLNFFAKYSLNIKEEILEILKTDIYIDTGFRIPIKGECSTDDKKYVYEISLNNYEVILKEKVDISKNKELLSQKTILEKIFSKYDKGRFYEDEGKFFIDVSIFDKELKNGKYYLGNTSYDEDTKVFLLVNNSKKKNTKHKLLILEDNGKVSLKEDFYNLGDIFVFKNQRKNSSIILNSYGTTVEIENVSPKGIKVIPNDKNIEGLTIVKLYVKTPMSIEENKFFKDDRYIFFYKNAIASTPYFKSNGNKKSKKKVNVKKVIIETINSNFIKVKIIVKIQEFEINHSKIEKIREEIKCGDRIYYLEDYITNDRKIALKKTKFEKVKFYKYEKVKK